MPPLAAKQAAARLWTVRAPGEYQPTPSNPAFLPSVEISCKTRFTQGRVRELKNGHNSVTVQNRKHVYMNFFHHKDLGNHLLQLCPKVVKHPVYSYCTNSVYFVFSTTYSTSYFTFLKQTMMCIHIFCRQTGTANTYCYSPTASCWHLCYLIPSFFFEVITFHTPNCFWSLSAHYKKYLTIKKQKILAKQIGKYLSGFWFRCWYAGWHSCLLHVFVYKTSPVPT